MSDPLSPGIWKAALAQRSYEEGAVARVVTVTAEKKASKPRRGSVKSHLPAGVSRSKQAKKDVVEDLLLAYDEEALAAEDVVVADEKSARLAIHAALDVQSYDDYVRLSTVSKCESAKAALAYKTTTDAWKLDHRLQEESGLSVPSGPPQRCSPWMQQTTVEACEADTFIRLHCRQLGQNQSLIIADVNYVRY